MARKTMDNGFVDKRQKFRDQTLFGIRRDERNGLLDNMTAETIAR